MSQYRVGTVQVTNGSPVVLAVDPDPDNVFVSPQQSWLTEAEVGYLFVIEGDNTLYTILSVDSDIQLTLTAPFTGASTTVSPTPQAGDTYALVRDFSVNFGFPLVARGDIATAAVLEQAMILIDLAFVTFNTLVDGETPAAPPSPPPPPAPPPAEDTDPPSVPTGVVASEVNSSSIWVAWDASFDVGGGSVAGYKVYKGGVFEFDVMAGTGYLSTGLDPNTQYGYTVSAYDDATPPNTSALSAAAYATTQP